MKSIQNQELPNISIIAPGLLGASLAAASKKRNICNQISIWARRQETRDLCEAQSWCDACFEDLEKAVAEADIVWICAPVGSIAMLAGKMADALKPGAVVSDVGSTKAKLIEQCERAIGDKGVFVGSHPMAGSEKSGTEFVDEELYTGKPCFVTPSEHTPKHAVEIIEGYWQALGMEVHQVSPREHDHIVASISHLPHLVASSLASKISEIGEVNWSQFVGSGLLDTTRVASGSVPMWMDIIDHNRTEILPVLKEMINELEHLRIHLESGQYEAVEALLKGGKAYRDSLG